MIANALLFLIRSVLALSLCAFLFYMGMSVWAALKWRKIKPEVDPAWTPGVSILKPVKGVDEDAYDNFSSYCRLDYPGEKIQLLFGVLDAEDPVIAVVARLKNEFPQHDIGIVIASESAFPGANRKVCNLVNLLSRAKYEYLVLSDSDMRAEPDYLYRILAPFNPENQSPASKIQVASPDESAPRKVGMVTCPYRGGKATSFAAKLEALGIASDFIPSALVSRALEESPSR